MDTPDGLAKLIETLLQQPILAIDTESDSLYSYFEKICLVQISTPENDFIVDPLQIDITPLGAIFQSETIQKVFHAAEYDIMSLRRDYGFCFNNLFDTMLASRILGWARYGLGHILNTHFKVAPNKRFQHYNWGKRPLDQAALTYARLDTHYLLALREIQQRELNQKNRQEEAQEIFEQSTQVQGQAKIFNPADFCQIKGAKQLSSEQQSKLQALYVFRDRAARRTNRPPFKIINDAAMVQLAVQAPKTIKDLRMVKGVGKYFEKRYGNKTLKLLRTPQPGPVLPKSKNCKPSEKSLKRYEALRAWRNQVAQKRGVEPDVILSNDTLMTIAKTNPANSAALAQKNILGHWQFKTYAKALLKTLQSI